MNLQQLRYLVATADQGTMTAAARHLHVAQPALSRGIRSLEAELGLSLFEPDGRGVRLTEAGERVLDAARVAVDDVDHVYAVARAQSARVDPLVVITTPTLEPLFARHFLPAYQRANPGAPARVRRASGREEVASAIQAGDAMVGLSDLPLPDGLEVVPLGYFEVVLLSPPGSTRSGPIPHSALAGLPLILPSVGTTRRREFDAFFDALGIEPVVALESDERGTWLEGVLAGIGSLLWYGERATSAIDRGAELARFEPPLGRAIGLSRRPGFLAPAAASFIEVASEVGLPDWANPTPASAPA